MSRVLILLLILQSPLWAQNEQGGESFWDTQYYSGVLLRHNKNFAHLVTDHPKGFIFSFNKRTNGEKYWQQAYNYPDWGFSFLHQDFGNSVLEQNYGVYAHINFYFLNRNLQLRLAEGIAYNTNPFDLETNFKNTAYGTSLMGSTYIMLNYRKENLIKGLGLQTGITIVHHSNGSFKAPNLGSNVLALNLGLSYNFNHDTPIEYVERLPENDFSEKIKYNILLRGGVNEGEYFNLGQHPFIVLSLFADKRINYKSTIQLGMEVFYAKFLEKEIDYVAISFPSRGLSGDEDFKRLGIFVGHEFRLGNFALPIQTGYYIYRPYEYETRVYSRVGLKRYFTDTFFGVATIKAHAFNAEAIEFGLGIRL
ncbi:MAG: acyloxyacyl hydrolase [Flavobacteriaceae bacterium]|nr:acyloxyacyl hydrolase [Flavobacteriaceae bacterium]